VLVRPGWPDCSSAAAGAGALEPITLDDRVPGRQRPPRAARLLAGARATVRLAQARAAAGTLATGRAGPAAALTE